MDIQGTRGQGVGFPKNDSRNAGRTGSHHTASMASKVCDLFHLYFIGLAKQLDVMEKPEKTFCPTQYF